jgi:transketolase
VSCSEIMTETYNSYKTIAKQLRIYALKMTHKAKSSHIGSSLSIADLIAVLYSDILRVDPSKPAWHSRDRFILSKGHACAVVYAMLAIKGFFPKEWLDTYYSDGGRLPGHITHWDIPGVEASTGSLGHGLSIGCGMSLAGKTDGTSYRVFTLLSDGECDEGSTWEAVMFAAHYRLDNLIAIIDYNNLQACGKSNEIIKLEPLAERFKSFGWAVKEINGHNFKEIKTVFSSVPFEEDKPSCIIAHTVKGKGVSFMENKVVWHYRAPNDEELRQALIELKETK